MQNILLQLDDSVNTHEVLLALQPFGDTVTLKPISDRDWSDNMDWMGKIYKVDAVKPLRREELYAR
ncbi:hypothetical protein FACS1894200_01960 [Spirochaetia bacterium]|nr:hypothetical protein FACS1894200_01960 [Spirochaetia bacterium]